MSWTYDRVVNPELGVWAVKVWRGNMAHLDVTYFRDKPTIIKDMTWADPFGPATAVLSFPQITGFDSPASVPWLREHTNVDIYFLPATTTQWHAGEKQVLNPLTNKRDLYVHERWQDGKIVLPEWEGFMVTLEPSTSGVTVQCQGALYQLDYYYAKPLNPSRPRSVEGSISRYMDPAYRGIHTKALKIDWPEDWGKFYTQQDFNEAVDLGYWRYAPTDLGPPVGAYVGSGVTTFTAQKWTGYLTRYTGSWDKVLTGYVQGQLSYLYATPQGGDTLMRGDQWTITMDPGRQPRMYVRKKAAPPTVECWYGQPGVEARLTRDGGQVVNVFFAEGRGANSSGDVVFNMWRQPNSKAAWCIWQPVAALPANETPPHQSGLAFTTQPYDWGLGAGQGYGLYHFFDQASGHPDWDDPSVVGATWAAKDNASIADIVRLPDAYDAEYERQTGMWVSERKVDFPDGVEESDAREIAKNWIEMEKDPGWSGTITLQVDLRTPEGDIFSKWRLREGHIIVLKGFQGQNDETIGVNKFHISQVTKDPTSNTVTLTVDTKFRDLLSVEEAIAKGRDTLSPVKSLQINRKSALLNDMIVGWNFRQGSGLFPRHARHYQINDPFPHSNAQGTGFFQQAPNKPKNIFTAAYRNGGNGKVIGEGGGDDMHLANPATGVPNYNGLVLQGNKKALYVPVHAGSSVASRRWATFPILLSQAGTIMRSEFAVYDEEGNLAPVEFHVSIYPAPWISIDAMPFDGNQSALYPDAFQSFNSSTGYQYNQQGNEKTMPDVAPIIGWGNYEMPAGYSPKTKIADLPELTDGNMPTGMLIDGAPWTYNFFGNEGFPTTDPGPNPGKDYGTVNVSVGCVVYIEQQTDPDYEWLYVYGRVYRGIDN